MLYMLYTSKYYSTILAHWVYALPFFLPFFFCIGLRQRRTLEEPVLRGLIPDRVRRSARDGLQEIIERRRDGLVRPRLEIPLRASRKGCYARQRDPRLRRESFILAAPRKACGRNQISN